MTKPADTLPARGSRQHPLHTRRHRLRQQLILLVAVLTVVVGGTLLLHLKETLGSFGATSRSAGQAVGYEAARSFDKLLLGLAAGRALQPVSEFDLLQRFEAFRSLVEELNSERHANLREPGSLYVVPEPLRDLVSRTAGMLESDTNLDQPTRDALFAEYQRLGPAVDAFVGELAARTANATAQRRSDLIATIVTSGVIATLLMLGVVLALLFVLRQQDRLKSRTEQFSETARSLAHAQRIAGVGTFHWDYEADRVRWSEQLARIYGVPIGGELTGETFRTMLHPDDRAAVEKAESRAVAELARTGEPARSEQDYRIKRPDGRIIDVAGVREIMADPSGRVLWMTSTIRDVTEEKRQRRALIDSERSLAEAQRIAHLGSFWVDLQTGATRWSNELSRITGLDKPAEGIARGELPVVVHPDDREQLTRDMTRALTNPPPAGSRQFAMQHRIERPDGTERFVRGAAEYTFGADGTPLTLTGSLQDVTEEHERELALQDAKAAAERANAAKTEFLAVMSYELRTPMNGVIGMLSALDETPLSPEQKRLTTVARNSADALLLILNDILDMSKIEAGRLELETTRFELNPLLRSVVHLYVQQARAKGITLDSRIAADVPAWLEGDAARLRQILLNLVSNAVKFTAQGGVMLEASGRSLPDGRFLLRIAVEDSGVGIPLDKQGEVFTSFSQLDRSYARRFGGTGLGLAISKRLAELMQGGLSFNSRPGEGTTFWFEAPLQPTAAEAPAEASTLNDIPAMKILVAEDNATNQLVARMMLENMGHRVDVADNGLAAVEALQTRTYDLVLMDVSMPVLDGIEATRRIRTMAGAASKVPIIAVTANAMEADVDACLAAGMNGFLSKPIIKSKLEAALGSVPDMRKAATPGAEGRAGGQGPLIDGGRLEELIGEIGAENIPELMAAYRKDIERNLGLIRSAVSEADRQAMARSAHSLKGIALNLGADTLARQMDALEQRCRAGATVEFQAEYEAIASTLSDLTKEVESIEREFGAPFVNQAEA